MRSRLTVALLCAVAFAGCTKKEGDAIVIEKEYIAAADPKPAKSPNQPEPSPTVVERDLAPDEIAVDTFVMKAEDRGTSRDPRAMSQEQWRVRVRLVESGRTFNVPADRSQFEKVKSGDRVHVRYQVGKYTDTVWGAELDLH